MLKLSIMEFFLRTLLESFIIILAAYAFSKKKIDIKPFVISTILFSIITYLIRMLPIHFGVHTILLLVVYILLMSLINGLDIIKVASSGLISIIIIFAAEWVDVYIITNILKLDINSIFNNPIKKLLYGIPSLLFVYIIIGTLAYKNLHLGRRNEEVASKEYTNYKK